MSVAGSEVAAVGAKRRIIRLDKIFKRPLPTDRLAESAPSAYRAETDPSPALTVPRLEQAPEIRKLSEEQKTSLDRIIGRIHLLEDDDAIERALEVIWQQKSRFVGFDLEATKNIASIISLATETDVYLIRLPKTSWYARDPPVLSADLCRFLESQVRPKVCFDTSGDRGVLRPYAIELGGMVDLKLIANHLGYQGGFKKLFAQLCPEAPEMQDLYPSKKFFYPIDWHGPLSTEMRYYAAYDARATLMVAEKLLGGARALLQ